MDFSTYMAFWGKFGGLFYILGGMTIAFLLIWWIVNARFYIAASFRAMERKQKGLQKVVTVCNDGRMREHSVNFLNDYYMDQSGDKDKLRALEPHGSYIDEFGEKTWYYNQDGTEQVHFFRQEKFLYVDKVTGEPLLDKNGRYVSKLSLIDTLKNKYEKIADKDFKKLDEYVKLGALDEVVGKKVLLPMLIGVRPEGTDAITTADILNRHMEAESLNFWKKYLPIAMLVVTIIIILVLIAAGLGYTNHKDIGALQTSFTTLQQTLINMTNSGGFR